jgi:hypothetical protein
MVTGSSHEVKWSHEFMCHELMCRDLCPDENGHAPRVSLDQSKLTQANMRYLNIRYLDDISGHDTHAPLLLPHRFAINFFTSIGLGGLTEQVARLHLSCAGTHPGVRPGTLSQSRSRSLPLPL